jgi:hypothetical protein
MSKGYVQASSDSPYVQEIKRQLILTLQQAVVLAWKHAAKCTKANRRPGCEAIEAVLERELELVAGLELEVENLNNWTGIVEVFDTPPPVFDLFETQGTKAWDELQYIEQCRFAKSVGMPLPNEANDRKHTGGHSKSRPLRPFRFRFTHERTYRKRIRSLLRDRAAISMQKLGRDRFLLDWILSPDIRTLLETSASTEPAALRRADLQQNIVWLTGEIMQQAIVRNASLDFSTNLIVETIVTEWDGLDGEIIKIEAVVCVCDGLVLIASQEEIHFVPSEAFLVDRALFSVERSRQEIENRQHRSRRKLS